MRAVGTLAYPFAPLFTGFNKKDHLAMAFFIKSGRGEREPVIFCKTPENQPFLCSAFPNLVKMSYTLYYTFLLKQL